MPTTNIFQESFSAASVERFKREAKVIHRDTGATHSHALDQIAQREGFSNWSRLMLNWQSSNTLPQHVYAPTRPEYRFQRDAAGMREAMRSRESHKAFVTDEIKDLSDQFSSPVNAVRYAIAYLELALSAPRYRVTYKSLAYAEMRSHFPYRIHETGIENKWILVNRRYKPIGSIIQDEWVKYEDKFNQHFEMSDLEALVVSDPDHVSSRGLYGDGSTPWHSRTNAKAYLERLRKLLVILESEFRT